MELYILVRQDTVVSWKRCVTQLDDWVVWLWQNANGGNYGKVTRRGKIQGMEMTLSTVRLASPKPLCETRLTSLTCADRMKVC